MASARAFHNVAEHKNDCYDSNQRSSLCCCVASIQRFRHHPLAAVEADNPQEEHLRSSKHCAIVELTHLLLLSDPINTPSSVGCPNGSVQAIHRSGWHSPQQNSDSYLER